MDEIPSLEELEAILAQHRAFGDSEYIREKLHDSYKRRLNKISAHLKVAGQLLDALQSADSYSQYRVIGDTVVRCAIQHAFSQLETGTRYALSLYDCEEVFRATIHHLELDKHSGPLESGVTQVHRLGLEPYHGWVWSEEHSDDIFGRYFRYLVRENYGEGLCTPNADELASLVKGTQLLGELLPILSRSALSHAHVIAVFPAVGNWEGTASSSQFNLGGTIFINRELLQNNPWWVAEHLFHEALHQKLYDFRHGHSVLDLDWQREDAPRVCSLWNVPGLNKSNYWDTHRAIAAFHVYTHLALLAMIAEQRAPELEKIYGSLQGPRTMIASRKALNRAHYLGEQLKEVSWQELGLAGKRFIDWLILVLDVLDPSPPPEGSYLHLLLDRYQREASMVADLLSKTDPVFSALSQQLRTLSKDELQSTRSVLTTVNGGAALNQFNNAVDQYSDEELGTKFSQVRRLIAKTLLDFSPDGYTLKRSSPESKNPDEIVKQMVESSSQRLTIILATEPQAVRDALHRADELRFPPSLGSEKRLGQLLAVLAAAVPSGGRILELGTGVGIGTAWMTVGLGARTDVELISVEHNPQLSEAVRAWPWPGYVQIVTADALEVIGQLGTFDLLFADINASSYGGIKCAVAALRPGGLLLVDDFSPIGASELSRTEKDRLRWNLFSHPELQAVELEWSSGIILAARRSSPVI